MTIRKLWLIILIAVSVISVGVNSIILTFLTDNYFKDYLTESYELHVNQILDYTEKALTNNETSFDQMSMELEAHLTDPIKGIKLYSTKGELLVEVEADMRNFNMQGMMSGRMKGMSDQEETNEVIHFDVISNNQVVGVLNITLTNVAENSYVARKFKSSLLFNSMISILIVSMIVVIIGLIVSKKMSRSLRQTAQLASSIQLGESITIDPTRINEVNAIRESLDDLDVRLKLRQKSRKKLVDELIHQTRTPLTILKSHIEAIEDGIIEADDVEFDICQNQIENLTLIISNMSGMIDADKANDQVKLEQIDINKLLKQIVAGLKPQYQSKSIELKLLSHHSLMVKTDYYKLSQSIFNILTNAYKYTLSGGAVTIDYAIQDQKLVVSIKDNGIGMTKEDQKKVFAAYYRGHNALEQTGDGIGLYIVNENIKQINGTLRVISDIGEGSMFVIELPYKD